MTAPDASSHGIDPHEAAKTSRPAIHGRRSGATKPETVKHQIDPVFDQRSEALVLGTMPSPKSREAGFFYGHPRNRFWPVLAAVFNEPTPETIEQKRDLCLRHHLALWDVLASCRIEGASDASIEDPVPNDLTPIVEAAPITHVFCTGATSERLYRRLCQPDTGLEAARLPSPSPANAAASFDKLVEAYAPLAQAVTPFEPPALDVAQVVELERLVAETGTSLDELMRRAGRTVAWQASKMLRQRSVARTLDGTAEGAATTAAHAPTTTTEDASAPHVVILCGHGNNGGDGWVAAECLSRGMFGTTPDVTLVTARDASELTAEPARTAALRSLSTCAGAERPFVVEKDPDPARLDALLAQADVAIDAMLGTGFCHDEVREPYQSWVEALNRAHAAGVAVLAADVPSGLNAQTGKPAATTVRADMTLTMIAPKRGLLHKSALPFVGSLETAAIAYVEPLLERYT